MSFESQGAVVAGAQGITSLLGGIGQARAAQARSEFQANQLNFNAKLSEIQAQDAISRGNEAIQDFSANVRRLKGSQRAALAAQGIDVSQGSAAEIAADTAQTAQDAVIRIRNNAWREAFGFRVQASEQRSQARLARIAGDFNASQTILTGALQAGQFAIRSGNLTAQALDNYFKNLQNDPDGTGLGIGNTQGNFAVNLPETR